MPQENKKQWIVIINRAPKGPLAQAEIQALIDEKIVKRNDLACLVYEDKSVKTEWKFLWQFPEFDRRIENNLATVSEANLTSDSDVAVERREVVTEETLKFKAKSLLPEEIEAIRTEDLIFHTTSVSKSSQNNEPDFSEENLKLPDAPQSKPTFVFLGIAVLIVGAIFLFKNLKSDPAKLSQDKGAAKMQLPLEQVEKPERAPADVVQAKRPSAIVQVAPAKKVEAPKAPDPGEIAYEEYRRKRDAEIERERQKEEESRAQESKSDEENEDDSPKKNKKKKDQPEEDITPDHEDNPTSDEPDAEHPPED